MVLKNSVLSKIINMTTDVIDTNNKPLTMVDLMAAVREILTESSARVERNLAESSARVARDLAESSARFERDLAKSNAESSARFERDLAKSSAKFEHELKLMQKAWDKQNKELKQQIGGMGNNNGDMAQEFFFNALFYTKTLFGQVFDVVKTEKRKVKKTGVDVQYDVMLVNGKSVCIVEVKYKADTNDVKKIATKFEKLFRENFPEHSDKKLYLALASMSFNTHVEKACKENGIAMIKQVGDTIEIYDEHLKVL